MTSFEILTRDDFYELFDHAYRPRKWFMWPHLGGNLSCEQTEKALSSSGVLNPPDMDFAGPVRRWYIRTADSLFTITCATTHDAMELETVNSYCHPDGYDENKWLVLKAFLQLPNDLFRSTNWLRSADINGGWVVHGIRGDFQFDFYRTGSEKDATEVAQFLQDLGVQPRGVVRFRRRQSL